MKVMNETCQPQPEYTATLTQRPDGNVLLTVSVGKTLALRKVLDSEAMRSEACLNALIHDLVRDIKLANGEVTWKGNESRWVKSKLPTFTGDPIQLTASKSLFMRRKIKSASG